jgi:hypothetical protein
MQPNKPAAHELSSYLSCLDKGFEPEVLVEHGPTWARLAREGRRPELAAEIEKKTAEARRECQRPKPLETSVSATTMPAPRAPPTVASQDAADWADVVANINASPGRAPAPKESPPAGARQRQSQAEIDAIYAAIAATLNASAGVKPRKAVRG